MSTGIAFALSLALKPFRRPDGKIDAVEVHIGALTLIDVYLPQVPDDIREQLIDNTIAHLKSMRRRTRRRH